VFVGEFAYNIAVYQLTVLKFVSIYCLERNSKITRIGVQRSQIFLFFYLLFTWRKSS